MSRSDDFTEYLAKQKRVSKERKLDQMLGAMHRDDRALYDVVLEALTAKDPGGEWLVPHIHLQDALRHAGYGVSHDTVRRWRRQWLKDNEQS